MNAATTIQAVVNTLNTISVSGAHNLSSLLGCIQILNGLREELESKPEAGQASDEGSSSPNKQEGEG